MNGLNGVHISVIARCGSRSGELMIAGLVTVGDEIGIAYHVEEIKASTRALLENTGPETLV